MVEPFLAVIAPALRDERPGDREVVNALIRRAFATVRHSRARETLLADALRNEGGATLALVAEAEGAVAGYLLASPVTVGGAPSAWHALGPVAVDPDRQGRGVGSALVHEAQDRLRCAGAAGCIVLGRPAFYGRFGFRPAPALTPPGLPARFFQILPFGASWPGGALAYHPAFDLL